MSEVENEDELQASAGSVDESAADESVVDDGQVRDTFVVRKAEKPIETGEQAAIASRLQDACGNLHEDGRGGGAAGESAGRKPAG